MSDTIELLEAIGSDASLRHASAEGLVLALGGLQASEGLKQAVCSGDRDYLEQELGHRDIQTTHNVNQQAVHEDDGDDEPGQEGAGGQDGSEAVER